MSILQTTPDKQQEGPFRKRIWTAAEKFLFRVLFIAAIFFIIPLESRWYEQFFASRSFFWYLSSLAGYRPNLVQLETESGRWGIGGYAAWGAIALIAIAGALIWSFIARNSKRTNYNTLYYWTWTAIRYRIALGIIAFGFLKVYPMQMPYPPLSNLLTDFGDYNTYKIYWQHVGVSIWYEIVLGYVEVIGGVLMLFRSTAAIGALINAGVLFNIAHANFGYDGGVHVYSSFFVLFSLIILIPYFINLWKVFIRKEDTVPYHFYPVLKNKRQKIAFYGAKFLIVCAFTILYAILRYDVHYNDGYLKEPINPSLPDAAGIYNVTEFRLNNKTLPYNPLDSVRWQNVALEKWGTLAYKVHKPFSISLNNGTPSLKNVDRNYELAGIAGGRRFLYYEIDSVRQVLYLQDKNKKERDGTERSRSARQNPGRRKANERDSAEKRLTWHYQRPSATQIILEGLNDNNDSIYVVLDKIDRPFPIQIKRSSFNK